MSLLPDTATLVVYVPPFDRQAVERVRQIAQNAPGIHFVCVSESVDDSVESTLNGSEPNIETLQLDMRLGKGAALRAGFNRAHTQFVGFLDIGGMLGVDDLSRLIDVLRRDERIDGVIADRFTGSKPSRIPLGRKLTSTAFNAYGKVLFGLRCADPQAPLKIFRRVALERVFEVLRLYNHGFDVELMYHAKREGFRVIDVPVSWKPAIRNWPLWPTAIQAALALLFLRAVYSPLRLIPFVELLGRKYCVPIKRRYSIMLFCWRDPNNPLAGGGEVYLHEQARHWVMQGHRVTWFAQRYGDASRLDTIDGIDVVRIGKFPFVFVIGGLWYLFRSGRRFDFIIDCMNGIPFFSPLFSTKPKVCLVYHIHSHHFKTELPPIIGHVAAFVETKIVPLVYRNTRFLTISESTRSEMEALHMSRFPIEIIHSGVARELVPGRKAAAPTVLYLGRLKKYKRVRKLIDAFAVARKVVPAAQLLIAGTGDDADELKSYARSSGCGGVEFAGRVSDEDKVRLMQEAWVFGMPSSIEGWGIVVVEANACATPAVAFDVRGLRDCIRSGETGMLVESDDEFAEALTRLLADSDLRNRMSSAAFAWSKNFSWAKTAERTLETIRLMHPWRAVFEPGDAGKSWRLIPPPPAPPSAELKVNASK